MLVLFLAAALAAPDASDVAVQYGVCVACHGAHGEGRPELGGPRLGDQDASYLEAQLEAYRDGSRGAHREDKTAKPMAAVARGLPGDEAVQALARYAASLEPEVRSPGPPVAGGAAIFAPCVACHGADATGNPALLAPSLLYQDPAYLERQLHSFRDGLRGGPDAQPLAQAMAAMAAPLDDDDIRTVVAYIASLRPERPPVENYEVTLDAAEGLAAFADIYAVASHPRCSNCHPAGDAPLHTDAGVPHDFGVTRFTPLLGAHCSTCHPPVPIGDGQAPLPPADSMWSIAPEQMVFEGRSAREVCEQLKDPELNGGRGHVALTAHIRGDHLLMTSWHSGRQPPPISHEELVKRFEAWGRAGGPCPE